jgi:hypothetical protein
MTEGPVQDDAVERRRRQGVISSSLSRSGTANAVAHWAWTDGNTFAAVRHAPRDTETG